MTTETMTDNQLADAIIAAIPQEILQAMKARDKKLLLMTRGQAVEYVEHLTAAYMARDGEGSRGN